MIDKIEKYLIRGAIMCMLMVVVAQGLMTSDPIRFYMSWSERMEGQSLPAPVSASRAETSPSGDSRVISPEASLTIEQSTDASLPEAFVLINGKARYSFSRKDVSIKIKAGDTVEIDARNYNSPINFTVKDVSANTAYPAPGQIFTANQSMVMVGKVIVK